MMNCQEYKEIIAAHVDGVLSSVEKLEAQSHLDQCPKCKQWFLWETKGMAFLKPRLSLLPANPGLRERLLDRLGESSRESVFSWFYTPQAVVAGFALLLAFVVPYLLWQGKAKEGLFSDVIAQYQNVTQGIADTAQTVPPLTPTARLLDLSPWGYRVLARDSQQIRGQEGRVFVYQGKGNEYLLAQEFEGVNLVAWKERDLLCILASTLSKDRLLALAQQIVMGG